METAISTLKLLPFSANQVELFSNQLEQSLLNGEIEPLELAIYLKAIEKVAERLKPELQRLSIQEAERYGKGEFQLMGAKVQVRELGTKYDYSNCGDIEFEMIESDLNAVAERKKNRESFLKSITEPLQLINEETGEAYKVYPPSKKSTTGIVITLLK